MDSAVTNRSQVGPDIFSEFLEVPIHSILYNQGLYPGQVFQLGTDTLNSSSPVGPDIFSEFLEVAIHNILYNRGLYPAGVFEKRKKYNVPVQTCLHPEVVQYVCKVTESVKVMVEAGDAQLVTMVILGPAHTPLERFVFELGKPSTTQREDKYLFRLEESLRAFMLKLNVCDAVLKPLPDDCSWVIHVHTKESTADKFTGNEVVQDFTWVAADEQQTQLKDASLVPLKSMTTDTLKMQMYAEESSLKPDIQT